MVRAESPAGGLDREAGRKGGRPVLETPSDGRETRGEDPRVSVEGGGRQRPTCSKNTDV